jgi:hypothetical protein
MARTHVLLGWRAVSLGDCLLAENEMLRAQRIDPQSEALKAVANQMKSECQASLEREVREPQESSP